MEIYLAWPRIGLQAFSILGFKLCPLISDENANNLSSNIQVPLFRCEHARELQMFSRVALYNKIEKRTHFLYSNENKFVFDNENTESELLVSICHY